MRGARISVASLITHRGRPENWTRGRWFFRLVDELARGSVSRVESCAGAENPEPVVAGHADERVLGDVVDHAESVELVLPREDAGVLQHVDPLRILELRLIPQ